jgi:hypothetical protein
MRPTGKRFYVVATVLPTLGFGVMLVALWPVRNAPFGWENWRPASCMPGHCFCEAIRTTGIRQPSNAWSSLAFVLVSLLVVGHALAIRSMPRFTPTNAMARHLVYPLLFALASLLIGFGSAFYHASLSFAGQFVDVFGMYLIATFVLMYNIGRLHPISATAAVAGYALANVALAALLYEVPLLRRVMFGVVIVTALAVELPIRRRLQPVLNGRLLGSAIVILAIGFAVWILDIANILCAPASTLQGHAVWHVAGAVSTLLLYFFYCSEGVERNPL